MARHPTWLGRPILSESHAPALEQAAAIHEFEDGLSREEAEARAHRNYVRDHHIAAAAHHLRGLRAAQASGDVAEARKHGTAYGLHVEALGHDSFDKVPPEVEAVLDVNPQKPTYRFRAHGGDRLLLDD